MPEVREGVEESANVILSEKIVSESKAASEEVYMQTSLVLLEPELEQKVVEIKKGGSPGVLEGTQ